MKVLKALSVVSLFVFMMIFYVEGYAKKIDPSSDKQLKVETLDPDIKAYLERNFLYQSCKDTVDTPEFETSACKAAIGGIVFGYVRTHWATLAFEKDETCKTEKKEIFDQFMNQMCPGKITDLNEIARLYLQKMNTNGVNVWNKEDYKKDNSYFLVFASYITDILSCR